MRRPWDFIKRLNSEILIHQHANLQHKLILLVFRFFSLVIAFMHIRYFSSTDLFIFNPYLLLLIATINTLYITGTPLIHRPFKYPFHSYIKICTDLSTCIFLVICSGGVGSIFIVYSLSSPLSASLIYKRNVTFTVAVVIVCAVIIGSVSNPFGPFKITLSLIQISIFVTAIGFITSLPYIVNITIKQEIESRQAAIEKRRISHEIHDGVAQTLHALCWQVQQTRNHLGLNNNKDSEMDKLEKLADKARRDILQALQHLRNQSGEDSLQNILKDMLNDFEQDTGIDCSLKAEIGEIDLKDDTIKELVSIFREALSNIKKHARAHRVWVELRNENGQLELCITDDGCGFDAASCHRDSEWIKNHHGLAIMKERAESISGRLKILSLSDKGTEVKAEVPLGSRRG